MLQPDKDAYTALKPGGAELIEDYAPLHPRGPDEDNVHRKVSALDEKKAEFEQILIKAEQNPEYAEIVRNATRPEDIPNDTWGAMVFIVVEDFPDLRAGRAVIEGKVRTFFVLFMWIGNLFIQGILLFFIAKLLMLPEIHDAQNLYKKYHEDSFAGGIFDPHLFESMSHLEKKHLCGMALSQYAFVRVIIFLWVATNMCEVRDNYRMMIASCGLPNLPDGTDTRLMVRDLHEREGGGEYCVICLNWKGKLGLLLLVFIPKYFIAIILTFTGCLWLASAESIGDLILNSLALAFVTRVDELMATAFFPYKLQEDIATLSIMLPTDPDELNGDDQTNMINRTWAYVKCTSMMLVTLLIVEVIISLQPIIPNYADDVATPCVAFLQQQVPWCSPWQKDCFPTS